MPRLAAGGARALGVAPAGVEDPVAWLTAVQAALRDVRPSWRRLLARPRREMHRSWRPLPVDAPLGPGGLVRLRGRRWWRRAAEPTLDTPAHRWLAARWDGLAARALEAAAATRGPWAATWRALSHALRKERNRLPVPSRAVPPGPPQAVQLTPLYRDVAQRLLALEARMGWAAVASWAASVALPQLFERWCAAALLDALAAWAEGPVRLTARGPSRWRAAAQRGDVQVRLWIAPRFAGPRWPIPQAPDFLLAVRSPGRPLRYAVLDAKYRRDDRPAYRRRFGAAGPPVDALQTLHRYRDALRPLGRITAAIALFPGPADPAFATSALATTLPRRGLGAVPLWPGDLASLERWLHAWLARGRQ